MKTFITTVLLTLSTLFTLSAVFLALHNKDYRQAIEFIVGYIGMLLVFLQNPIANLLLKLF